MIELKTPKPKDTDKEENTVDLIEPKSLAIFVEDITTKKHHVYLSHSFGDMRDYYAVLHLLRTVAPDDSIVIYLNNYGGDTATGLQILNALKASPTKHLKLVVDAHIYSMASHFVIDSVKRGGASLEVGDNVLFMFHNYSSLYVGKGNETVSAVLADKEVYAQWDRDALYPFFSHEEIERMIKGEDMYVHKNNGLLERLGNLSDYVKGDDYYDGNTLVKQKRRPRKSRKSEQTEST